jgi:hypothetical protein
MNHIVRSVLAAALLLLPAVAHADGASSLSVVDSQFTDKVEHARVTYRVAVKNDKTPTSITLVWKLDGKEAGRQSLDIGTSPAWKTWGTHWVGGAKAVEVDVLDATGATVKTDTLEL